MLFSNMMHFAVSLKRFLNPFQPNVSFIEISHLFCRVKQMTGFYIKQKHWVEMG